MHRGVNAEIWVNWLDVTDMVADPHFLDIYPDYPSVLTPKRLSRLPGEGFDTLRIPADPAPLLALLDTPREALLLDQLRQRVVEAQAGGLKVILDLHAFPRPDEDYGVDWVLASDAHFERYLTLVSHMAVALNGLPPQRTAFQLMNEPVQDCDLLASDPAASTWPQRLKRLHDVARQGAPDLPLVLSGACWGGAWALSFLDPEAIGDDNVLWSFHSYDPFTYSHQSAQWTSEYVKYFSGITYPPSELTDAAAAALVEDALGRAAADGVSRADLAAVIAAYRAEGDAAVRTQLQVAADWADAHAVPRGRVIMDEFGAIWLNAKGQEFDAAGHLRFLSDKRRAAEDLGFGWAIWSWTSWMRFGDPAGGYEMDPRVCNALGAPGC